MPDTIETTQAVPVDPDIQRFVDAINASYAKLGAGSSSTLPERRAVAERVREPWRNGGPEMFETRDLSMDGLRVRLHRPTDAENLPALLYIHGGGWTVFSLDTHDRLMREYAARAGIAVIGIDYSLSPESKFPVALEECSATLDWMIAQAAELGIDPARLLVGGDSAGANLSVSTCLIRRERHLPMPRGMVLNYGAFAADHLPSYALFSRPEHPLLPDEMDEFWRNYVDEPAQLSDPLVAPLLADLHDLPPAFIAIAECDILADCNVAFGQALAGAGVPVEAVTYRGATHSFLEAVAIAPLAAKALEDQATWIRKATG